VEERNLSTQPYYRSDIGAFKAQILANSLYRAIGIKINAKTKELTSENSGDLIDSKTRVIVDTFDNSIARQAVKDYCDRTNIPGLHIGMASDYAEIIWNENYRVPSPTHDDICDYPLARNLVTLTVAIACETLVTFVATGERKNFTVTLADLAIAPY
jgi:molybdopterin/thiamine biosynthesis adenylyltransferase